VTYTPPDALTFVILALATFRLARLVTTDTISRRLRDAIWKRHSPTKGLGYLITCNWCLSIYVGIAFEISRTINPVWTLVCAVPLALSAAAGLLTAYEDKD
jgi:hypothetical protein